MRTIKFRGKRVDNSEWVEGDLMQNYIHHEGYLTIVQSGCIYYKVIPETVGQFTELIDKNGKDIFCGDRILFADFFGGKYKAYMGEWVEEYEDLEGVIEYSNGSYYIVGANDIEIPIAEIYEQDKLEVIGDIHEKEQ